MFLSNVLTDHVSRPHVRDNHFTMAQDLWASSRLIYRGCDGESDDDFVATLGTDPESLLNSAPLLPSTKQEFPKPQTSPY